MTVEEMKSVDVRTVDRDSLVDVTQVRIDEGLTKEVDLCQYFRQKKSKDYAAFLSSSSSFC